jgi:two-component system chemotaxis response regulator CheB
MLSNGSVLPVKEIEDKEPIEPGRAYLAPADYHLLVEPGHFALSTEAAVGFARPSIDVSLESAADSYGDGLVAVVLTGANDDGSKGLAHVKRNGGFVIAQDPEDAARPAMPRAAIKTGFVDLVVPLDEIAGALTKLIAAPVGESR